MQQFIFTLAGNVIHDPGTGLTHTLRLRAHARVYVGPWCKAPQYSVIKMWYMCIIYAFFMILNVNSSK